MASDMSNKEIVDEILDMFRIYKDGTIERLKGYEIVPPSIDPQTGVQSKDVVISPVTALSARLYIPKSSHHHHNHKLPLLIYFHGGGFCIESAFSPLYHNYLNSLVSAANIVAVSVNYRKSPEHPLPIPFDDSWAALNWAIGGGGGDDWLTDFADLNRVFFAGDSAGGNIAYNMGMRVGSVGLSGAKLKCVILVQPWFGGEEPIGSEEENPGFQSMTERLWRIVWPSMRGLDDPVINPNKDPKIAEMGCDRLLVCVAEKDTIRDRGVYYYEGLRRSGWKGEVEMVESAGEDHVFHLFNPTCENALALLNLFVSFFNQ